MNKKTKQKNSLIILTLCDRDGLTSRFSQRALPHVLCQLSPAILPGRLTVSPSHRSVPTTDKTSVTAAAAVPPWSERQVKVLPAQPRDMVHMGTSNNAAH